MTGQRTGLPWWAWPAYLLAVIAGFAALEGRSLTNGVEGDTLSERTRSWIGMHSTNRAVRVGGAAAFAAVLYGLLAWFGPHILGG
jgi:hypothetical protein